MTEDQSEVDGKAKRGQVLTSLGAKAREATTDLPLRVGQGIKRLWHLLDAEETQELNTPMRVFYAGFGAGVTMLFALCILLGVTRNLPSFIELLASSVQKWTTLLAMSGLFVFCFILIPCVIGLIVAGTERAGTPLMLAWRGCLVPSLLMLAAMVLAGIYMSSGAVLRAIA